MINMDTESILSCSFMMFILEDQDNTRSCTMAFYTGLMGSASSREDKNVQYSLL